MAGNPNCPNAYRKNGAPTIFCLALHDQFSLCGHQYMCGLSKRYELTKDAEKCRMRGKNNPSVSFADSSIV